MGSRLAVVATIKATSGPLATLLATSIHVAPVAKAFVPKAIVAPSQVMETAPGAPMTPVRETIPDVEADEAVAIPRGPPSGTPGYVGRPQEVLEVVVPGTG